MRLRFILIGLLLFDLFGYCAYAQQDVFIERPDIVWLNPVILGSITPDYHYMLEADSSYNDINPILQTTTLRTGIIYQHRQEISFWFGYAFFSDLPQREIDTTQYQNLIWEQLLFLVYKSDDTSLYSRIRLEQTESPITPQWSFHFRKQFTINFMQSSPNYQPFITDEVIFNFNNPTFVGERFVDENDLYIGISITLSPLAYLNIAYANQVQFGIPINRMNHILNVQLTLGIGTFPRFFIWGAQGV